MKRILLIILVVSLLIGAFLCGTLVWKKLDAESREAFSSSLLIQARMQLEKGHKAEAVFLVGSATTYNTSALVLLTAGEILIDANERSLARDVLVRALSEANESDTKLQIAIKTSLDRVAREKTPSAN